MCIFRHVCVAGCEFPAQWNGHWFQSGIEGLVTVNGSMMTSKGRCIETKDDKFLIQDTWVSLSFELQVRYSLPRVCVCVCTRVYERLARYRQAAVDMKRCTDRISRPFIRVSPRHHPRPSATELLLINCTLRWPDPPTKRSRRRANRQHSIKRFSGEIPRRKGSGLTGRGWSKDSCVSRYYDGCFAVR